jgi:hypothetical protein
MFQCLENQYDLGVVNMTKENAIFWFKLTLNLKYKVSIQQNLEKENKNIELLQIIDEEIRIKQLF